MYETIVLGATYTAAGIGLRLKKKCLILEQSFQAGGEFFGALNFGKDYHKPRKTPEGEQLYCQFFGEGATPYVRNTNIYPLLQNCDVLFGTQIVSIEKNENGFLCKTYGINGYDSFTAKNVIDTRCTANRTALKTYNLLMLSATLPSISGVEAESTGIDCHYVLRCPVSLSCDYNQAHEIAENVAYQFSDGQKLILLADEFDHYPLGDLPETANGVRILPSKAYPNPICAFEAGLEVQL